MSITAFVSANKTDIDSVIRASGYSGRINNEDRRQWILNDESLYLWARSQGVKI